MRGLTPPIADLAQRLVERYGTATSLRYDSRSFGDWRPLPGNYHENAAKIAAYDQSYRVVHGWLCYVLGELPIFFDAHSVLEKDCVLFDFTPAEPTGLSDEIRSFLPHPGSDAEFAQIVFRHQQSRIFAPFATG